ncbi:hypothetical protein, partial [Infirmifilum sp.]|uniref:hypothetical protein n=1 Tax=Infirmifilum sp. TaxID=2856575 RepID=UPI003D12166F
EAAQEGQGSGVTPGHSDYVTLEYDTWGSYGQYRRTMAVLVDGTVIDPREFRVPSRSATMKKVITLKDGRQVEIIIEDDSSRKNVHRTVYVPAGVVFAVVADAATSGGHKGFSIREGEGEIFVREREVREENAEYIYVYKVTEAVYKGGTVEAVLAAWKELAAKTPKGAHLKITNLGVKIEVTGMTYEYRDIFKSLGFEWNGLKKAWVGPVEKYPALITALQAKNIPFEEVKSVNLFEKLNAILEQLENLLSAVTPEERSQMVKDIEVLLARYKVMRVSE